MRQAEVQVKVGDKNCVITSFTEDAITCFPPQSGNGVVDFMVSDTKMHLNHLNVCSDQPKEYIDNYYYAHSHWQSAFVHKFHINMILYHIDIIVVVICLTLNFDVTVTCSVKIALFCMCGVELSCFTNLYD